MESLSSLIKALALTYQDATLIRSRLKQNFLILPLKIKSHQ